MITNAAMALNSATTRASTYATLPPANRMRAAQCFSAGTGLATRSPCSVHSKIPAKPADIPRNTALYSAIASRTSLPSGLLWARYADMYSATSPVANGINTTHSSSTRLRKSSRRSTTTMVLTSAWWLTQMMPITKKLITYAANDGQCEPSWWSSLPCPGPATVRLSTSRVIATAKTPSLNASSLDLSTRSARLRPGGPRRRGRPARRADTRRDRGPHGVRVSADRGDQVREHRVLRHQVLLDLQGLVQDRLGVLIGIDRARVGGLGLQVLPHDDDGQEHELEEVRRDPGDDDGQVVAGDRGGQADQGDDREDVAGHHGADQGGDGQANLAVQPDPPVVDLDRLRRPSRQVQRGAGMLDVFVDMHAGNLRHHRPRTPPLSLAAKKLSLSERALVTPPLRPAPRSPRAILSAMTGHGQNRQASTGGSAASTSRRAFLGLGALGVAGAAASCGGPATQVHPPAGSAETSRRAAGRRKVAENSLPGDRHWEIRHLGSADAIAGYA